jgi:hypothetical protein
VRGAAIRSCSRPNRRPVSRERVRRLMGYAGDSAWARGCAHDGRYDRVLDSLARFDAALSDLWTWLQAHDQYRGRRQS